jgi:hypothetical protein
VRNIIGIAEAMITAVLTDRRGCSQA